MLLTSRSHSERKCWPVPKREACHWKTRGTWRFQLVGVPPLPAIFCMAADIARPFQPILTALVHLCGVKNRFRQSKGVSDVMKVEGSRPIDVARTLKGRGATTSAGGFAPIYSEESKATSQASGAAHLAGVDALLALQGVPGPQGERAKAARRGRDILDLLDEVRMGMLEGAVSKGTLNRLLALVETQREEFVDPGLSVVLDEIDLRARVELAKLSVAFAK